MYASYANYVLHIAAKFRFQYYACLSKGIKSIFPGTNLHPKNDSLMILIMNNFFWFQGNKGVNSLNISGDIWLRFLRRWPHHSVWSKWTYINLQLCIKLLVNHIRSTSVFLIYVFKCKRYFLLLFMRRDLGTTQFLL